MLRGDSKYSRNLLTVPSYRHYFRNARVMRTRRSSPADSRWQPSCTFFLASLTIVLIISSMVYLKSIASKYTHHWKWRLSNRDEHNANTFNSMQKHLDVWLSQYPHIEPHRAFNPFTCDAWRCKATYDVSSEQWIGPRQDYVLSPNINAYNNWQNRHKSQSNQLLDKNQPCDWIFIGDSITFHWDSHMQIFNQYFNKQNNAVVYAQSGDKIHEIGWRLTDKQGNGFKNMEQCLLHGKTKKKSIVLLIGTNDIGCGSSYEVALTDYMVLLNQLSAFMTRINKKQNVVLYLVGIFPRAGTWAPLRQRKEEKDQWPSSAAWNEDNPYFYAINFMNEYLKSFAQNNNKHIKYIDCNDYLFDDKSTNTVEFKDNKGTAHEYRTGVISTDIMEDLLHLSDKGYQLWSNCVLTERD
eukprot:546392_1